MSGGYPYCLPTEVEWDFIALDTAEVWVHNHGESNGTVPALPFRSRAASPSWVTVSGGGIASGARPFALLRDPGGSGGNGDAGFRP